jgi:hypothetical protein
MSHETRVAALATFLFRGTTVVDPQRAKEIATTLLSTDGLRAMGLTDEMAMKVLGHFEARDEVEEQAAERKSLLRMERATALQEIQEKHQKEVAEIRAKYADFGLDEDNLVVQP